MTQGLMVVRRQQPWCVLCCTQCIFHCNFAFSIAICVCVCVCTVGVAAAWGCKTSNSPDVLDINILPLSLSGAHAHHMPEGWQQQKPESPPGRSPCTLLAVGWVSVLMHLQSWQQARAHFTSCTRMCVIDFNHKELMGKEGWGAGSQTDD